MARDDADLDSLRRSADVAVRMWSAARTGTAAMAATAETKGTNAFGRSRFGHSIVIPSAARSVGSFTAIRPSGCAPTLWGARTGFIQLTYGFVRRQRWAYPHAEAWASR